MASVEARHPIGVVSDRTGLTPDILRVWERRHRVVEPTRTPGGQRLYSDSDIERLMLLRRATQGGHGISLVANMSSSKLDELVRDIASAGRNSIRSLESSGEPQAAVEQAIRFTEMLDPAGLEILLRRNFARYGTIDFLDFVAAPFLRGIGEAWHAGKLTVSQEHLATALVQRVVSQTAPLPTYPAGSPTIVLATLQGERHANGALMAAATAANAGWQVIYLGSDLPLSDLADATTRTGARVVGVSVVLSGKPSRVAAELRDLDNLISDDVELFVGGDGSKRLSHGLRRSRMVFIESMFELHNELARIHSSAPTP